MEASVRKIVTPQHRQAWRGSDRRLVTQHPRRRILSLAVGAAALPTVSRMAWAQPYPTRPITMVVPFPPGGTTDVLARIMAERMKISLGQSIIVENVTGANGTIGVGRA